MGTGFPISSSMKQKLNTRSSTESEIIVVDDFMSSILWTRNFLNAQDYDVTEKSSFRITIARFFWRRMVSSQVERNLNILTYGIFL